MPNAIHTKIKAIEPIIQSWTASTNPELTYRSTNILVLKNLLSRDFEVLKSEFSPNETSILASDIEAQLDVIQQHIPSYPNQAYFNACVTSAYEIFKLLHSFGYINHRLSKIISTSLANRKLAASTFNEVIKTAADIKIIKSEIDEYKTQLEEFYIQCFGEEEDSYKTKLSELDNAYTRILDDDGYLEKIEAANKEADEYRDEILEYKTELLDGDSENESIKQQIHELNQEMLSNQIKMETFIRDYIVGETSVTQEKDGSEKTTKIKSKKELIDELHKSFELHIEAEKTKIAGFIDAFESYKAAKQLEIEGLLKGATNASLASAFESFRSQTETLKKESEKYFFGTIIALVVAIILPYVPWFKTWMFVSDNVYVELLKRVLFTGPLVWLAYYQAKKTNQYFRLEQEYAHKAVVSRSFEGYKSQVLELYKDNSVSQDMLQKLLVGSIETIAKNPAEVLDGIKGSSHPLEDIKENLSGFVDPITKLIDTVKR
jgi:hypothetical protein